jgi:hypothetical protein
MGTGYETKLCVYHDHMKRFETRKTCLKFLIGRQAETASKDGETSINGG